MRLAFPVILIAVFLGACEAATSELPGSALGTSQGLPPEWTATPRPTLSPVPTSTPPYHSLRTTLPSEEDVQLTQSIWDFYNLSDGLDLERPGARSFNVDVAPAASFLWPFFWCSADEASLEQNLQHIDVKLMVDGMQVPAPDILEFEGDSEGWRCHFWATMVSEWKRGSTIALSVEYTLAEIVDDGYKSYPAGDYSYTLRVQVAEE